MGKSEGRSPCAHRRRMYEFCPPSRRTGGRTPAGGPHPAPDFRARALSTESSTAPRATEVSGFAKQNHLPPEIDYDRIDRIPHGQCASPDVTAARTRTNRLLALALRDAGFPTLPWLASVIIDRRAPPDALEPEEEGGSENRHMTTPSDMLTAGCEAADQGSAAHVGGMVASEFVTPQEFLRVPDQEADQSIEIGRHRLQSPRKSRFHWAVLGPGTVVGAVFQIS